MILTRNAHEIVTLEYAKIYIQHPKVSNFIETALWIDKFLEPKTRDRKKV